MIVNSHDIQVDDIQVDDIQVDDIQVDECEVTLSLQKDVNRIMSERKHLERIEMPREVYFQLCVELAIPSERIDDKGYILGIPYLVTDEAHSMTLFIKGERFI